jgi:ubiquinone/menaquinone biosynthesis C-methylase UbiE
MGGRLKQGEGHGHHNHLLQLRKRDPLLDLRELGERGATVSGLFTAVDRFCDEKREQSGRLREAERAIGQAYLDLPPRRRARFFSALYDRFSDGYDQHMAETGHYAAIRRCLQYAMPFLSTPMIDLTTGTGEVLSYALEFSAQANALGRQGLEMLALRNACGRPIFPQAAYANEISAKMLEKAHGKMDERVVTFASHDALALPAGLAGMFGTALCSQTFHIISDEDKGKLVHSMRRALAPGGFAVVLEEDPFRITQSVYIEALSLFLRAVVRPIKPGTLIALFETNGFSKLEDSAIAPIDSEHSMRVHIFQKQ